MAQPHDTFLAQRCGFTSSDFLALLQHAELQINSALNNRFQCSRELMDELLLRVIAELTDHPSTFIHYFIRRVQANDVKELNVRDELDLLGFYRAGQLFFPPGEKKKYTMLMVTGFTEEIAAYYDGLVGWRPKV